MDTNTTRSRDRLSEAQRLLLEKRIASLEGAEDALVVSSFSKYFSMVGWRLGWLLTPPDQGIPDATQARLGAIKIDSWLASQAAS